MNSTLNSSVNSSVNSFVPALFPKTDFGTRAFLTARWRLTPYARMCEALPAEGRIGDFGSGHGLLALAAALNSPKREVLGFDHDPERVKLASAAAANLPNVRFEQGSLLELPVSAAGPFAGIALIDVMHYFDPATQEKILKEAAERLSDGGTLIFREVDPAGGPASGFNRFYEKIATFTGFTKTESRKKKEKLFFRPPEEWVALLKHLGLEARCERCSHFLFADVLFVGTKEIKGEKGPAARA